MAIQTRAAHITNLLVSAHLSHLCNSSTGRLFSLQLSLLRPAHTTPATPLNHFSPIIPDLLTQTLTVQAHHETEVPPLLHMILIMAHPVQSDPCHPLSPPNLYTITILMARDIMLDPSRRFLHRDNRIVPTYRLSLNSNNPSTRDSNSLMYPLRTHISRHMVVLPDTRRLHTALHLIRVRAKSNLNTLSSRNNRISLLCKGIPTTTAEMFITLGRCISLFPRLDQGLVCSPC
jgi:hypothetical protein